MPGGLPTAELILDLLDRRYDEDVAAKRRVIRRVAQAIGLCVDDRDRITTPGDEITELLASSFRR